MWYPFNYANRNGIPMIESRGVSDDGTNAIITVNNRVFSFLPSKGVFLFRLNTAIPTAAAAYPVVFSSNNITQPLTVVGGAQATGADLDTGVHLVYYDKSSNLLQLMSL